MRLLGTVVLTTSLLLSSARGNGVKSGTNTPKRAKQIAACPDATIREIDFGTEVTVDQIWVDLRAPLGNRTARDAAVRVEVSAGGSARHLIVAEMGVRGLRFSPGLRGERFQIVLDPELTAKTGACVERIVLLRGGEEIAVVQP